MPLAHDLMRRLRGSAPSGKSGQRMAAPQGDKQMGKIREFTCPSCQKSWRINVGHGLRHATLENVIQAFPPEIQQKIKETAAKEQLPLFEFHYSAALCAQCQAVVSVPVIRFLQTGKQYTGVCPDCGSANSASLNDDLNGDSNSGIPNCSNQDRTAPNAGHQDCESPVCITPDDTACLCPHCGKAQLSVQDTGNWD